MKLGFKITESGKSLVKGLENATFYFDSAYIVIEKAELKKLKSGSADDEENEYNFKGPYKIDLINGTSDPVLPLTEIDAGVYTKFEAEMSFIENVGYSLYISGQYNLQNGKHYKMEYSNTRSEDFKCVNEEGFRIETDMVNMVWVYLDLNRLMNGVDLSNAQVDRDDVIRLNNESNIDLADIVERNLEAASELGFDNNADGRIDK